MMELLSDHLGQLQSKEGKGESIFRDETQSLFMLHFMAEVDRSGDDLTKKKANGIFNEFLGFMDEWSTGEVSVRGFYSFAHYQSQNDPEFARRFCEAVRNLRAAIDACGGTISKEVFEPVIKHLLEYLGKRYFTEEALPELKLDGDVFTRAVAKAVTARGKVLTLSEEEINHRDGDLTKRLVKLQVREGLLSPRRMTSPQFDPAQLDSEIVRLADTSLCCPPGWASEEVHGEWKTNKARQLVERALASSQPFAYAKKLIRAWQEAIAEHRNKFGDASLWASSLDRRLTDLHREVITGRLFNKELMSSGDRTYHDLLSFPGVHDGMAVLEKDIARVIKEGFWCKMPEPPNFEKLLGEAELALERVRFMDEERRGRVDAICEQPPYVCDASDQQERVGNIKRDRTRQFQKEGVLVFRGSVKVNGEELEDYEETPPGFLLAVNDALQAHWPQDIPEQEGEGDFGETDLPEAYLKLIAGSSISAYQIAYEKLKGLWSEGCELGLERVKDIGADYELVARGEEGEFAARTTYWYRVKVQDPTSDQFCEVGRFQLQAELSFDESVDLQEIRLQVKQVEFQGLGGWGLQRKIVEVLRTMTS